jgi:hypothetical protein
MNCHPDYNALGWEFMADKNSKAKSRQKKNEDSRFRWSKRSKA